MLAQKKKINYFCSLCFGISKPRDALPMSSDFHVLLFRGTANTEGKC